MRIISNPEQLKLPASVVAIGMFDGVHRGHRRVLRLLRDRAHSAGLPAAVVTFDPHPRAVLRPDAGPALLSTLADRLALIEATGCADYCLVLPFDRSRSAETAQDFVQSTLLARLGMRSLVVGANFACGHKRQGNVEYLTQLGEQHGYSVLPVALHGAQEEQGATPCSSTETRRLIMSGDIASAAAMLERPHELPGIVQARDGVGRSVIDVALPDGLCAPPAGQYAGAARKRSSAAPWIDATLEVLEAVQARARTVRLFCARDAGVDHGDAMTLRFLASA
jgi:riboflavin kinase/FMN adenylyltransferase